MGVGKGKLNILLNHPFPFAEKKRKKTERKCIKVIASLLSVMVTLTAISLQCIKSKPKPTLYQYGLEGSTEMFLKLQKPHF